MILCDHCNGRMQPFPLANGELEGLQPSQHCTCPHGPLWDSLAENPGIDEHFKLREGKETADRLGAPEGTIVVWSSQRQEFVIVTAKHWRIEMMTLFLRGLEAIENE